MSLQIATVAQHDAQSSEFLWPVHALERLKQLGCAGHVKARTVVAHAIAGQSAREIDVHANLRSGHSSAVFPGVVQQVLHQRFHQRRVCLHLQAGLDRPAHPPVGLMLRKLFEQSGGQRTQSGRLVLNVAAVELRQLEQAVDQLPPSSRWRF